jgi:tRNA G18 (ribose-2'-O)-methylase SpoU
VNKEIAKTALGAETSLPWEKVEDVFKLIKKLKAENYQLIALEQAENSVDYKTLTPRFDLASPRTSVAVILGNEVEGIAPEILNQCDAIAEIPMKGKKESLNVAVAAGVALFRWLDK